MSSRIRECAVAATLNAVRSAAPEYYQEPPASGREDDRSYRYSLLV